MNAQELTRLAEAIAVTAEVCGSYLSEAAVKVYIADLQTYPLRAAEEALQRTRREHKGRLSLGAVIERISDERPGADEAWATLPKTEAETAVLSEEMRSALAIAQPLIDDGDLIGGRMAFKDAYTRAVSDARAAGRPAKWSISTGWDAQWRVAPLAKAVAAKRITVEQANEHLRTEDRMELLHLAGLPAPKPVLALGVKKRELPPPPLPGVEYPKLMDGIHRPAPERLRPKPQLDIDPETA